MKKLLAILVLLISSNSFAQLITFDEVDEFTGNYSILVQNSKSKQTKIEDDISIDSKDYIFMSVDINVSKDKTTTLNRFVLGIISKKSKCYNDGKLHLLFESGEVITLSQSTKLTCDTSPVIGYTLTDMDFVLAKNNLIKKIRITHTEGANDYAINPKQQANIQETLQIAFDRLKEIQE